MPIKKTSTEEVTQKKSSSKKPAPLASRSGPAGRDFVFAVGRRKESVARVRLYSSASGELKKGEIIVNGKRIEEYFPSQIQKVRYLEPLHVANAVGKYAFTVKVSGGGINSQLDALVLGISRALVRFDSEKHKSILRKKGF